MQSGRHCRAESTRVHCRIQRISECVNLVKNEIAVSEGTQEGEAGHIVLEENWNSNE